jgi:hypothetical protein
LAMDAQLDRAHCHQHVALPVFSDVNNCATRPDLDRFVQSIAKLVYNS